MLWNVIQLDVQGEPSAKHNLDMQVLGRKIKLEELLRGPLAKLCKLDSQPKADALSESELSPRLADLVTRLDQVLTAAEPLQEAVALARSYCAAQHEATLNTLARAWQKPDFCIRRDAVGPERDRLLTTMGSWDADWYYGKRFDNVLRAADDTKPPKLPKPPKPPAPAGSV